MLDIIENEYLPHCLAIGITEGEFWNLNIRKLRPFLKAEEIKRERRNEEAWLQGLYTFKAVSVVVSNVLSKKGAKLQEYFDKPIRITPYTEKELEEQRKQQLQHTIDYLNSLTGKEDKKNG